MPMATSCQKIYRIGWSIISIFMLPSIMGNESPLAVYNGMYITHNGQEHNNIIAAFLYVDGQSGKIELPADTLLLYRIKPGAYMNISAPPFSSVLQRYLVVSSDMDSLVNAVTQWQKSGISSWKARDITLITIEYISELTRHIYIGWLQNNLTRFQSVETLAEAAGFKYPVSFKLQVREGSNLRLAQQPEEINTPLADHPVEQPADNTILPAQDSLSKKQQGLGSKRRRMTENEAYRVIGVDPHADAARIQEAYKELRDMYYQQSKNGAVHRRIWRDIQEAYNILEANVSAKIPESNRIENTKQGV